MITSPMIANVSVFFAASTCFGSPPEVTILMPDKMMKNSATIPEKSSAAVMMF